MPIPLKIHVSKLKKLEKVKNSDRFKEVPKGVMFEILVSEGIENIDKILEKQDNCKLFHLVPTNETKEKLRELSKKHKIPIGRLASLLINHL